MPDLLERLKSALADRYAVESEIGRGGMATVFLAEDLKHHRKVAIKVLHPELAASVGTDRFLREIETVAGLTHPHVLPLHDSGEEDGLLYFVMPYVKGESLRQRLEREKQLPVEEAIRIAQEVAGALDHAHREGVVHRDIKPANILLEEGHAVVADFGVARAVSAAGGQSVTATGMAVGTPAYMSPEQAAGEEVDERSDLYALGCILYEMLAGEPPLVGPTPQATAAKRLANTPTPLSAVRTTVPASLASLVERVLAPTAADRPATARQLAEELEEVHRSPGAAARRSPAARWLIPVVGVAAVAVVVAAISMLATDRSTTRNVRLLPVGADLGEQSIAVLPFTNNTGLDSLDWLCTGLAGMLITDLNQLESIRVVGAGHLSGLLREAGHEEADRVPDDLALNVAAASGARTMAFGSIVRLGDGFRLDAQLVDVDDGTVISAESARGPDVGVLVDEVSASLVRRLAGEPVTATELTPFAELATGSLNAYREYQQGLLAAHRFLTDDAIEHYQRAVELDSTFALAWLRLGMGALSRRNYQLAMPALRRAEQYSAQALDRDRMLIQAFLARISRERDEYIDHLEEMVAKYPDDNEAWFHLGVAYRLFQERWDDALRVQEEVLARDPYYIPSLNELVILSARAGDELAADSLSLAYLQLEPDQGNPYDTRGMILTILGRDEEAREMYREAIRRDFPNGYVNLYDSYMVDDDPMGARAALEPFRDRPSGAVLARLLEADSYASEGRYLDARDAARSAVAKADELGDPRKHQPLAELGGYAHYTGAYDEAEEAFLEMIRNDWRREFSLFQLFGIYGKQERYDEMSRLRDAVAAAIEAAPDAMRGRAESHLHYADALIAWYRDRDAEETVRRFAGGRIAGGLSTTDFFEGTENGEEVLALIQVGRARDALDILDSFRPLVQIIDHYAWYLSGRAYEALGDTEQALASYQQLLDVAGDRVGEVVLFRDTPERVAALRADLPTQP